MNSRKRRTLSIDEVIDELRRQIAAHELSPGSKLLEQELATQFKVSRAYIREALRALQQRGLVTRIPNRGAVVDRLDLARVSELYTVYERLEGLAVLLATESKEAEYWQDLVDYFDGPMGRFVADGDLDSYIAGLERFQESYVEAAGNSVLRAMIDSVRDRVRVIVRRIIILPGRAEKGLAEHRATLAAMRAKRPEEAEQLKRANIRSARDYLARYQRFVL